MSTTLGLDIGTNSIGWCLMEDNNKILDIGVRIFPVGVKEDDYNKSGSEISKNATRRTARGIRRLYDRYKLRRKQLKKLLLNLSMLSPDNYILSSRELYKLRKTALDEKISLKDIGCIFLLLNQRRGFKSNKKEAKTEESKKELSEIKIKMNELKNKIDELGYRTVGEYFYSLFEKNSSVKNWHNSEEPVERIRNRFVYRSLYENEFDKIWNKQKEYYKDIFNDDNYKKIKDNCIFYQRPLKSQKHLVGKCRFEPRKRVSPKSSYEFQEFRIWNTINNLRINFEDRFRDPLSIEEKNILASKLMKVEKLKKTEIKKILNLGSKATFNEMPDTLYGNTTYSKLSKALDQDYFDNLDDKMKYKLWHTLFFANDEEWLMNYAIEKLGFTKDKAEKFVDINLEQDYSNISVKAIRKILPYLKSNNDYAKSCELAGYHHSYDEDSDSKERVLKDKIEISKEDNLRNPLVQQSVSESIRLVNALIREYGKPDKIKVEFARELKKPKDKREKMKRVNDEKDRKREDYRVFLKEKCNFKNVSKADILKFELWLEMEFSEKDLKSLNNKIDVAEFRKFAKNIKSSDKEKYELYLECGRISPYTGKVISIYELFSPEIEVEHIIPYSKCMDDSFLNKTLSEREFNKTKGNLTPYEYFKSRPDELYSFKERIKHFSDVKQERFLMEVLPDDFLNSQLTNNAYIAKQTRKKLKTICRDVNITNGQATSVLRNLWELNKILNPDGKNEKSRFDHRHHAIDALVIANTKTVHIRLLSTASHFDYRGKLRIDHFPIPYNNFYDDAESKVSEVLVSYRNKKRLVTSKINKYVHSKKDITQKSISIRGPLHEETFYGQITNPNTSNKCFVVRKPITFLEKIKQIEKVVDLGIRKILIEHIKENGGENNIKKALTIPVFIKSKDGSKKIPIKSVRMIDNSEKMIQLRPNVNDKLFVSSGNNYLIAIYEDSEGNRDFETITFHDATSMYLNNKLIIKPILNNKHFLLSLIQKDMVIVYDNNKDEINWNNNRELFDRLFRVIKFDVTGQIFLGRHNISKIDLSKDRNVNVIQCRVSTFKGIKVKISTIGKIVKCYD